MVNFPHHYCDTHFGKEAEYLANRQRWARSRGKGYQHRYNTVTRNRSTDKTEQYNFYRSREWTRLRRIVLERDHYLCQYCQAINVITPAKTVDHIVPVEFDSTLKSDPDNLAVTCYMCHRLKTEWEQEYYGTGQGNKLKNVPKITKKNMVAQMIKTYSPERL